MYTFVSSISFFTCAILLSMSSLFFFSSLIFFTVFLISLIFSLFCFMSSFCFCLYSTILSFVMLTEIVHGLIMVEHKQISKLVQICLSIYLFLLFLYNADTFFFQISPDRYQASENTYENACN